MAFDPFELLRKDVDRIYKAFGFRLRNKVTRELYHVAEAKDVPSIMGRGLDPPVYMLAGWEYVGALKRRTKQIWEEYGKTEIERSMLLKVTLPSSWVLRPDEAFPESSMVSEKRVPPKYITVVDDDFWGHI